MFPDRAGQVDSDVGIDFAHWGVVDGVCIFSIVILGVVVRGTFLRQQLGATHSSLGSALAASDNTEGSNVRVRLSQRLDFLVF